MMAYDSELSSPGDSLWSVIPLARQLQRQSKYPVVVLTNITHFGDGTPTERALRSLNVRLAPLHRVKLSSEGWISNPRWEVAFWKLQIWTLTSYDKVVWLDSDSLLSRDMDWIFDRDGMVAQRDDWFCYLNQPDVCSGILSAEPSLEDFNGLIQYATAIGPSLTHGDQELISRYFRDVRNRPIALLADNEAAFGQCAGRGEATYLNSDATPVRGVWNMPAFLHKSGGWGNTNDNSYSNVCFTPHMVKQELFVGASLINVCHFHTLAYLWRSRFCEGIEQMQLGVDHVQEFCDDDAYYGRVNSTLSLADYALRLRGVPAPDLVQLATQVYADMSLGHGRGRCADARGFVYDSQSGTSFSVAECLTACGSTEGCIAFELAETAARCTLVFSRGTVRSDGGGGRFRASARALGRGPVAGVAEDEEGSRCYRKVRDTSRLRVDGLVTKVVSLSDVPRAENVWTCHHYVGGEDDSWCDSQYGEIHEQSYAYQLFLSASPCECSCCTKQVLPFGVFVYDVPRNVRLEH